MVRISKQAERRAVSKRRPAPPAKKTGPKQDALPQGFKYHENAVAAEITPLCFVPKIK